MSEPPKFVPFSGTATTDSPKAPAKDNKKKDQEEEGEKRVQKKVQEKKDITSSNGETPVAATDDDKDKEIVTLKNKIKKI